MRRTPGMLAALRHMACLSVAAVAVEDSQLQFMSDRHACGFAMSDSEAKLSFRCSVMIPGHTSDGDAAVLSNKLTTLEAAVAEMQQWATKTSGKKFDHEYDVQYTWRLQTEGGKMWNLADVATYKSGERNNLNAPCSASSSYSTQTCENAFNGIMTGGNSWSCDWNVQQPTYWIEWKSPAADTIKIWQSGHEHSRATLTYAGKTCQLELNGNGQYVEFNLSEVCTAET